MAILTCIECSDEFDTFTVKKGKRVRLLIHNRKYCLKCLPFGVNARKKISKKGQTLICSVCDIKYLYRGRQHDSTKMCSKCKREYYDNQRTELVSKLKEGGCILCGYNKCNSSLVFHHLNRSTKEFTIGQFKRGIKAITKEAKKCVILCRNCHGEVHAGISKIKHVG